MFTTFPKAETLGLRFMMQKGIYVAYYLGEQTPYSLTGQEKHMALLFP